MNQLVTSHNPSWKASFSEESDQLLRALGRCVEAIHHIGSTAIPNILAKPTIDVLIEVSRIGEVDTHTSRMSELGYEALGEHGIVGRRYFRRSGPDGRRAFHVHVFETSSESVFRHIAFRDYLLAHPNRAEEYSALKARIVASGAISKQDYQLLKAPFIEACMADAIEWSRNSESGAIS